MRGKQFIQEKKLGYPWFDLFDQHMGDQGGSDVFSKLKPVQSGKKQEVGKCQ